MVRYPQVMAMDTNLVTVYRSTDMDGEQDATAVRNLLIKNGLNAELFDDKSPGMAPDSYEVRVPNSEAQEAEALVARVDVEDESKVDPTHDLDMVTIAELQGATGEMEALGIQSILDANGISAIIQGASTLPNLPFMVTVAREDLERAQAALAEAKAAGPAAAAEAALESERPL
jgi:hypothetical protein